MSKRKPKAPVQKPVMVAQAPVKSQPSAGHLAKQADDRPPADVKSPPRYYPPEFLPQAEPGRIAPFDALTRRHGANRTPKQRLAVQDGWPLVPHETDNPPSATEDDQPPETERNA